VLTLPSGAGPIGLVTLLATHAAGCYPIVITDLFESRLEFAKTLVKTVKTISVAKGATPEDMSAKIKEAAGEGLRVALECTGVESSIRTAIYVSWTPPQQLASHLV
jgi:L-iditol 2-dehydrogenase